MVSRWFQSANELLSQVGEVLAPTVKTPFESFKNHWRCIRNFYIDEKFDDSDAFHESALPEHLVSMITILLEEERDANRQGTRANLQPCLEFFMSNRIMETFCYLAEKDRPPGVRKFILLLITQLLSDMPQSILPNMSVHKPIRHMIVTLSNSPNVEKSEFNSLISVIVSTLRREPSLVGFFFEFIKENSSTTNAIPAQLFALEQTQSNPSSPQETHPDNNNSANSPKIDHPNNNTVNSPSDNNTNNTNGESKPKVEFVLLTAILNHFKDEGVSGDRARESLLSILQLPQDQLLADCVLNQSNLIHDVVGDLIQLWKALPPLKGVDPEVSSPQLLAFKTQLQFCDKIIASPTKNEIISGIGERFEDQFCNSIIGPALLTFDESAVASATLYLRESLTCVSGDLLRIFVTFLLGDFSGPETESEEGNHLLRSTLIRRINSPNEELCVSSLKLFETMIGLFNRQVMYNLIFRNLTPRYHLLVEHEREELQLENVQSAIASYLTLLPDADFTSASSSYNAYLLDAQQFIMDSRQVCSSWPKDPQLLSHDEVKNASSTSINSSEGDNNNNNGSTATSTTQQLLVQKLQEMNADSPSVSNERFVKLFYGGGLFLQMLFTKLNNVLSQPLSTNLILTGMFTKLCHYPYPLLYSYLLNKTTALRPGIPSLWSILQQLSLEVRKSSGQIASFQEKMAKIRTELAEGTKSDVTDEAERTTLFGILVVEEFSKDLAATLACWTSQ